MIADRRQAAMSHVPPRRMPSEDRAIQPFQRRVDGVLGPRFVAWIVDLFVVALLGLVVWIAVWFIGLLTLGLGWLLLPAVGLVVAMAYAAFTIGGPAQATFGMRAVGLAVERTDGGPPDPITAAAHCLLFYVATFSGALLVVNVLFGLLRDDRRLGHDLLTGFIVLPRRAA
jgi:uncharacterized RDD family membrane protein YckC